MNQNNKGGGSRRGHAALGRVAEAISQRRDFKTVPGYQSLPESVRTTLERLEDDELRTLAKAHDAFAEGGLYEDVQDEHGDVRVSFF